MWLLPCVAATAVGRARALASKSSWARQSGSFRIGPSPGTLEWSIISHLPRRVAAPPRVCRDFLSLHEKRVGGERRSITHRHAVVNECTNTDRAPGAKRGTVGFERAILQRVTLDRGPLIQDAVVADRGQS